MTEKRLSSLRSTAHPLRLRMLSLLTGASMSAAEVARELAISHANASYHLRLLADAGLVEVEGEERIRGGVAKRYRHVWDHEKPAMGRDEVEHELRAMTSELLRRADQRDGRMLLTDAELWVTPEVWDRVLDLLGRAAALVHDEAQPPRAEGAVPVNVSVAAFRMGT
jgi:DNA-binding transcriptional ArsR family regulator